MLLCGVVDFFPDMAPVEHIGWSVLIGTEPDKILVLVNDPDVVMFPELDLAPISTWESQQYLLIFSVETLVVDLIALATDSLRFV